MPHHSTPARHAPKPGDTASILDIAFGAGQLYTLRQTVAIHAHACGAGRREADKTVLIASELAMNVLLHAGTAGRLRLWTAGGDLYCQVSDSGPGLADPDSAGMHPPRLGTAGKRGLWIVRMVAEELIIDSQPGATTITARIPVSSPAPRSMPSAGGTLPRPMTARVHLRDGHAVAVIDGELSLDTASRLAATLSALIDRNQIKIVLDAAGLTFCDSVGLSAFIGTHRRCAGRGGYLRVAAPSPALHRLLTVVGLAEHIAVYSTVAGAISGDASTRLPPEPGLPVV